jgi:hypothetical protein
VTLLAACSLTRAPTALAAGPASSSTQPAPLAQALQGEARSAYAQARLVYKDGDFAGAYTKFKRAYDLAQDPRLLWDMAACEKAQRHYARAYTLVGRYLREGASILTAANQADAEATRKALRAFYSLVILHGAPDGSRVVVDGEDMGATPLAELAVDLGVHAIRVEHDGFEPFETRVELPGTADIDVNVAMKPKVETATLSVAAEPADSIAVDGKLVGVGRWDGALPAGPHSVTVTAQGHKPYEASIDLAAGSSRTLQVTLVPEKSSMPLWPWIVGGAVVVAGGVVGGYFLFKPEDQPGSSPHGALGQVVVPAGIRLP